MTEAELVGGGGKGEGGDSKDMQSTGQRQRRSLAEPRPVTSHTLSYLLVGVRPVEAQEEVGGLAVQEEIGCPERDGKASDGVAEVECDPEVLGVRICEDVLQRREQLERAGGAANTLPQ